VGGEEPRGFPLSRLADETQPSLAGPGGPAQTGGSARGVSPANDLIER